MSDDAIAWTAVGVTAVVVIVVIILLLLALRRRRTPAERSRRVAVAQGRELRISPHHADDVLGGVVADHAAREQAVARAAALRTARQSYEQAHTVGATSQGGAPAPAPVSGVDASPAVAAPPATAAAPTVFTDTHGAPSGEAASAIGAGPDFSPEWMTQPGSSPGPAPSHPGTATHDTEHGHR